MNPDVFFENFELLADAPNGVQKLRELILQLAVMGKLVPQDPNDEPASGMRGKNAKSLRPVQEDEIPFDYPEGWIFTRMDQISNAIHYGYTASANNSLTDVRLLRITDIQNNKVNWETVPGCEIDNQKLNSYALNNNDLLIARTGGTIGKSYLVENLAVKAVFASYLIRIVPNNLIFPKYLKLYADSPLYWDQLYSKCSGTGQPNVNATSLKSLILPLPPLAEQKRIVSKVGELMTLCDKFEARRQKKREIQSKLNSAALDRMLSAENQEEFEQHWQHICKNFDLLYDNPENVEKLRHTILQLAVQGKLVEQNLENEPASVLIEKIKAEKKRCILSKEIQDDKKLSSIATEIPPWIIPPSWKWIRLQEIFEITRGGSPRPAGDPQYFGGDIPWITVREITKDSEKYLIKTNDFLTELGSKRSRFIYPSDLLLTNSGATLGVPKISKIKGCINDGVARLNCFHDLISKDYVYYYLFQQTGAFREVNQGMGQPNLNTSILSGWFFPLPPFAEQKRIVEKVEQLMGLCDELESKLRKESEDSEKLMEAVVKGLLESADTEKPELKKPIPLQTAVVKLK